MEEADIFLKKTQENLGIKIDLELLKSKVFASQLPQERASDKVVDVSQTQNQEEHEEDDFFGD